jgi:hypothetical protein
MKILGRSDEPWLRQVAVQLHLVQTHLAFSSSHKFIHVTHMQTGIKQAGAEIDGLFLGKVEGDITAIITVEAKGTKDDILLTQVLEQAKAVLRMRSIRDSRKLLTGDCETMIVIPMAMKVLGPNLIYVAEYESISYDGLRIDLRTSSASSRNWQLDAGPSQQHCLFTHLSLGCGCDSCPKKLDSLNDIAK